MSTSPRPRTEELFARAQNVLVGGVNSPVRAFRAVGGTPLLIDRALGSRLWDADGREFIDYVCSWGALILGHALPFALNRCFLIPLGLRGHFLRAPLGCLGIRYAPGLRLFSLALTLCFSFKSFLLQPAHLCTVPVLALFSFPRSTFLRGDPLRFGLLRPRLSLNALILNAPALTLGSFAGKACLLGCAALCGILGGFGSGFLTVLDGAFLRFGA